MSVQLRYAERIGELEREIAALREQFRVAARETVMALDGLDATWKANGLHPYGEGVSNWDGPSLLRRFLAADSKSSSREG